MENIEIGSTSGKPTAADPAPGSQLEVLIGDHFDFKDLLENDFCSENAAACHHQSTETPTTPSRHEQPATPNGDNAPPNLDKYTYDDLLYDLEELPPACDGFGDIPWFQDYDPVWQTSFEDVHTEQTFVEPSPLSGDVYDFRAQDILEVSAIVGKYLEQATPGVAPSSSSPKPSCQKKHACPECNKTFRYPKDVSRHQKRVHGTERPFRCPHETCKYHWIGFNRKDASDRHMKVHLPKRKK